MASEAENFTPPLSLASVTIGVLTALAVEYAACLDVFDPDRTGAEQNRRVTSGTMNCWLCRVRARHGGQHVVAISLLPDMGNNAAAIVASILLQQCPGISHLIMCGIARAVPHPEKPEDHVRLGDIVVSSGLGVIQYDRGKQRDLRKSVPSAENSAGKERFAWKILRWLKSRFAREVQNPAGQGTLASDPFVGFDFRGPPRPPCPVLLQAVKRIHADEELLGPRESRVWESKIEEFLRRSKEPGKWKRPSSTKDKLVDSPDGRGAGTRHPKDNRRRSGWPRVFRGPIGAANIVQADPRRRDALRERHDIRAVEMEGSGVADAAWVANTGYLVVRGTCDYCNSTKGDDWHHCAALIAAAYTRTVIEYLHPILPPTVSSVPEVPTLDPSKLLPIGSPLVAKHLPGEPPSVATLAEATPARSSQAEAVAVLQKAPAGIAVKPAGTAPDIDPGQPETAVSAGLTQRMAGETQAGGADVVASSAISDPGLFTRSLMLAWK